MIIVVVAMIIVVAAMIAFSGCTKPSPAKAGLEAMRQAKTRQDRQAAYNLLQPVLHDDFEAVRLAATDHTNPNRAYLICLVNGFPLEQIPAGVMDNLCSPDNRVRGEQVAKFKPADPLQCIPGVGSWQAFRSVKKEIFVMISEVKDTHWPDREIEKRVRAAFPAEKGWKWDAITDSEQPQNVVTKGDAGLVFPIADAIPRPKPNESEVTVHYSNFLDWRRAFYDYFSAPGTDPYYKPRKL